MTYLVPKKILRDVVFSLDDFAQEPANNCINYLMDLKIKYPKLKVTLFSIPYYGGKSNRKFFKMIKDNFVDWIQLAIHGWDHKEVEPNEDKITDLLGWHCFEDIYKAPNWKLSNKLAHRLNRWQFVLAENGTNLGEKSYDLSHPWCVHGHTWNLNNPKPEYNNGIQQIIERGVPWDKNTNFHWIWEAI